MGLTVLVGGARSGKSALAVRMARGWDGPVAVVATAEARDPEMAARIARHRRERPAHWETLEEPRDLVGALRKIPVGTCLIIDCLTLWVSNLLEAEAPEDRVLAQAEEAARLAAHRGAPGFVVSNEVGSGIVPANALARSFRDLLGRVNALWVQSAHEAFLVVAGRLVRLEQPHVP
ncbi:MAG: bifunctional adenosylcobinamide kinase/adenosylcobinamide-phosphate guanylyltransferase [Acidimicrobiia bacterium]